MVKLLQYIVQILRKINMEYYGTVRIVANHCLFDLEEDRIYFKLI